MMLPLVVEWKREGDGYVGHVEYYRVDIQGTYSLDTLPYGLLETMQQTDKMIVQMTEEASHG